MPPEEGAAPAPAVSPLVASQWVAILSTSGRCYVGRVDAVKESDVLLGDAWVLDTPELLDVSLEKAEVWKNGRPFKGGVLIYRSVIATVQAVKAVVVPKK